MAQEATIRRIDALEPIEGADRIELATVGGWKVVVQKDIHKVGDLVIYVAIDTFLPDLSDRFQGEYGPQPWSFLDKAPREFVGYGLGYKVRSIKLRKKLSQGVILPLMELGRIRRSHAGLSMLQEGQDISDELGAKHYEKPIPGNMKGRVKGNFPSFIPKTDQERAQNLMHELIGGVTAAEPDWSKVPSEKVEAVKARWNERKAGGFYRNAIWEVSTKLDGSSITIYNKDGQIGVCSRNLELDLTDKDNVFIKTARETGILDILKVLGKNWALQGELMGPGVQDNHEGLGRNDIFIYNIYDIDAGKYLTPDTRQRAVLALGLRHVPAIRIMPYEFSSMDDLIANANGPSMINPQREGLVYKHQEDGFSFKTINNEFLLAKGE